MSEIHNQDQNKIDVLQFPDNIRSLSGMYIGSKGDCTNILREAIDNAMDELNFVPEFTEILIESGKEGSWFMVVDQGRGMPTYEHPQYSGFTAARVATSVINAGGKFSKSKVAAGMNGTGIKTTNALSETFILITKINNPESLPAHLPSGEYYAIRYKRGIFQDEHVGDLAEINKELGLKVPSCSTAVYFEPDYSLISSHEYDIPKANFMYKAFLMHEYSGKDISIKWNGEEMVTPVPQYTFKIKHQFTNLHKAKKNKVIDIYFSFELNSDLRSKSYKGSVNSLVVNDGLHVKMAVAAIRKAISKMTGCEDSSKLEQGLKLRSILSAVKVDFKSQTKEYCNVIDGYHKSMVDELVPDIIEVLSKNPKLVKDYVSRVNELEATYRKLKDKQYLEKHIQLAGKSKKQQSTPKSLFDSGSSNRDKCELFICEGKSAGGTLVQARDPEIHAVLGLRGRPLNTVVRDIKEVVKNPEMQSIINVIGMGVNQLPNLKNKRFGKIIIAADADPDGGLITSSILATMVTHMTFLFNLGMVYVAESPLFYQDGKYIFPSDDVESMLDRKKPFTRFKGLGEINPSQARDIFFNPKVRRLVKVNLEGSSKAVKFLEKNAKTRREMAYEIGTLTKRLDK